MNRKKDDEYPAGIKNKQAELFAEFQASHNRKPGHLFRQDIALGKKISFQLSYENLILFLIVLIMLFVVFFSLGVEKGKSVNRMTERIAIRGEPLQVTLKEPAIVEKKSGISAPETTEDIKIREAAKTIEREPVVIPLKAYTIQVIAFKKEHGIRAEKELQRLKKDGHDAFTIPTEEWIQVCVGRYANKDETKKDLDVLRYKYPNCYVRKISK